MKFPEEVHWRGGGNGGVRDSGLIESGLQEMTVATSSAGDRRAPPSLKLPEPAIQPLPPLVELLTENTPPSSPRLANPILRANTEADDVSPLPLPESMLSPKATQRPSLADHSSSKKGILGRSLTISPRPFVDRVSQFFVPKTPVGGLNQSITDAQIRAAAEFHQWLVTELFKIEEFYKKREFEAVQRFDEMKEQLDILRDRWFKHHYRIAYEGDAGDVHDEHLQQQQHQDQQIQVTTSGHDNGTDPAHRRSGWRGTLASMGRGKHDEQNDPDIMSLSSENRDMDDARRDYERRRPTNDPGHRLAKSKLKYAYIEYYHRLELLKSYVQLNRDAFRKITKKFDKISGLRMSGKFMNEHINRSYYGGSENKLDDLMNDTEVLFARYILLTILVSCEK